MRVPLPAVGRETWRLLAGVALFEVGTGMTLPLVIVFLHASRGLSLGAAGFALSAASVAGLAVTPLAGAAVDRTGAVPCAVGSLVVGAAGQLLFLAVHGTGTALLAATLQTAGFAGTFVALFPLLAATVPPEKRGEVFALNYALTNLGLGIGGAVAGVIVGSDTSRMGPLFVVDALSYLSFAGILLRAPDRARAAREEDDGTPHGGYLTALRDRSLLGATLLNTVFVAAGYSQISSGFPAWATGPAGATSRVVGFAFAANTFVIAAAQLFVARAIAHARRTRAVAGAALVFGLSWLVTLAAGAAASPTAAAAFLIAGLAVFGLGETLLAPSLPALVNDLAAPALRGRYTATYSLSWQTGPIVGPVVAGAALGAGHGSALMVGLAVTCAAGAPLALVLERRLPPRVNHPAAAAAVAPTAPPA